MDHVARNELIKNDLKCRDFLDEAKDFQLSLAHVVPDRKLSNRTCPRKSCAGKKYVYINNIYKLKYADVKIMQVSK